MLAFLCYSNLRISWIEKSITLILIQKHYEKYKFALELIGLLTVSNLFPLKVVQKCQHCQLCVLWDNTSSKSFKLT